jgi:hypothetical protein
MSGPFALQLQKFAQKTGEKADLAVGRIVIGVAAELDRRSPVGDSSYWQHPAPKGYVGGRFRGNWQLGVGVVPAGETGAVDTTGAETQGRIIAAVPEKASGLVYYLVNNVPYARRIEDGWSRQAPQGLVGLTTIMFQRIVDEAVAAAAA